MQRAANKKDEQYMKTAGRIAAADAPPFANAKESGGVIAPVSAVDDVPRLIGGSGGVRIYLGGSMNAIAPRGCRAIAAKRIVAIEEAMSGQSQPSPA